MCVKEILKYDITKPLYFKAYGKKEKSFIEVTQYLLKIIEFIELKLTDSETPILHEETFEEDILTFFDNGSYERLKLLQSKLDNNELKDSEYYFINLLKDFVSKLSFIEDEIFLEIYFELEGSIFQITKDSSVEGQLFEYFSFKKDETKEISTFKKVKTKIELHHDLKLFYNLVVNYSIYGLNSDEIGIWVEKIFHKNDGYQTPIVINPFRNKGNIDIDSENGLVKDRLMYNMIVNTNLRQVTSHNKVSKLIISKKKSQSLTIKIDIILNTNNTFYEKYILGLISFFNSNSKIKYKETSLVNVRYIEQECLNYIIKKLERITINYSIYNKFRFNEKNEFNIDVNENNIDRITQLLVSLEKDRSHITHKLHQAINFIFLNRLEVDKDDIYNFYINEEFSGDLDAEIDTIDFSYFAQRIIEKSEKYNIEIINLLPPSIFVKNYVFENKSKFSQLSSGEKQQIFSLNSILYHLINLNSTMHNSFPFKYPNINLILDEIELYSHPEMQRRYVLELLDGISKLQIDYIKAINVQFITHSPFILSDIPKQNVLFLQVEKILNKKGEAIKDNDGNNQYFSIPQNKKETFASNVHEILTQGFFMDSTKGAFALSKIEEILDFYQKVQNCTDLNKKDVLNEYHKKKGYFFKIIEMVGESYVKNILKNHFIEIQNKLNILDLNSLKRREEELERELKSIRRRLNE